jgi:hypothetical protein
MGDSLPKRRDDLALGRALPDPEKTDDDFPDLNPIDFFFNFISKYRDLWKSGQWKNPSRVLASCR